MPCVFWFRRDLRLKDNPALLAAVAHGDVLPVFVFSKELGEDADRPRIQFLVDSLKELDSSIEAGGGKLCIRYGDPVDALAGLCAQVGATKVFSTKSWSTFRSAEDAHVADKLAADDVTLELLDSPYAIEPGTIYNKSDNPFKVFTPFSRAWASQGWSEPDNSVPKINWLTAKRNAKLPDVSAYDSEMPPAGEDAAHAQLEEFMAAAASGYSDNRNLPGVEGTSRLSHYLKWGTLHPRQILAKLPTGGGAEVYRSEIVWREFYADVLHHRPETATEAFSEKMSRISYDEGPGADEMFERWATGQTGFPIVDAGMRQLVETGWMHNRVRMIVASFLTKDLHIWWGRGAEFFMHHLIDGDLASNSHGWQWTAGTGTDASPYFRVFNPVTQGRKFDKEAIYIRRWIPEIVHLSDKYIHEPWLDPVGAPAGYPAPIVDHAEERLEALARYEEVRAT